MKVLTCYNQKLQKYNYKLTKESFSKKVKNALLNELSERLEQNGEYIYDLLPNKKMKVVDHILYLLTASGVNTIHTRTLMKKFDIKSRTTIVEAVKVLKDSRMVLVCRLKNNNHPGTYVFVLKTHPDFKMIMKELFSIDTLENIFKEKQDDEKQDKEQQSEQRNEQLENAETVDTTEVKDEKTDSISFISSIFLKQGTYIKQNIENDSLTVKNSEEYIKEFATNEHQLKMYYYVKSENFHDEIKKNAVILGLRVGSNCTHRSFAVAKNVVKTLSRFLDNGIEVKESIPSWFSSKYEKELRELDQSEQTKQQKPSRYQGELPFYDWLNS